MANAWTTQRSGSWSRTSDNADSPWYDGGTQTARASIPADGDGTITIGAAHNIEYNGDHSAWSTGLANLVITGGATPGMLYCSTTAGTYWLMIKTGCTLAGTTSTNRGRLVVNSDGTWAGTGVLPTTVRFMIDCKGTGYIDASNLDQNICHTAPTIYSAQTYGTKLTVSAVSAENDTLTIDDGAAAFPNTTPVMVKSSATLPGGLYAHPRMYYVYNRTLVAGTTYTIQLREYASTSVPIIDITSVGSGTIEIYNGHSNLATGQMNVLTDVTSDPLWVTTANWNAVILTSPNLFSPYYDIQRTTLSNIAAGAITLAVNVDSVQKPGALICLNCTNVQIITNTTSTSTNIVDWKSSTFTGSILNASIRCTSASVTDMTTYGRGMNAGVSHSINSIFNGCYIGVSVGSGHSGTWTANGCYNGVYSGSGHSGTWTTNGCYIGVSVGSGHSGIWTANGCYNGVYSGYGHSGTWTVNGCYYGVYTGSGYSGTWTANGCIYGVSSGSGYSGTWTANGCYIGVSGGSGHSGTWTVNGCNIGVYSGSGHSGTWAANGCYYGVNLGSYGYVTLTANNCTYTLRQVDRIQLYNSTYSGTENSLYQSPNTGVASYASSADHGGVANAEKDWSAGGVTTSQTTSPPTGYTIYYRMACESATVACHRDYLMTVDAGQALIVTGLMRNVGGSDLSGNPPKLQIIDVFHDPLVSPGSAPLSTFSLPVSNGTNTTWQDVAVSWTNTAASQKMVYVRAIATHATEQVDIALYTPPINAQVSAIYTKLPTNYIMGSSDVDNHDTTIDTINTNVGTPVALDSGTASLSGMLTKMADDNNGGTYDATYNSLNKLYGSVVVGVPTSLTAGGQVITTGAAVGGTTYTNTALDNSSYFTLQPANPGGLDAYLTFQMVSGQKPNTVRINGYWSGNPRYCNVYAWNWLTSAWDQLSDVANRINHATGDQNYSYTLLNDHYDPSSLAVRIRFYSTSTTTTDRLYLDQVLVNVVTGGATAADTAEAVYTKMSYIAYDGGVYIDTVNGTAGTDLGYNGLAVRPCLTYADALVVAAALGVKRFYLKPGTSITLTQGHDGWRFIGAGEIDFNGQSIADAQFENVYEVHGTSSGDDAAFTGCGIGTSTLEHAYFRDCMFKGDITLTAGDAYYVHDCSDFVEGGTTSFTFAAGAGLYLRNWRGGVEIKSLAAGDEAIIDGAGRVIINSTCSGGSITIRGHFTITDQVVSGFTGTLSDAARWATDQPVTGVTLDAAYDAAKTSAQAGDAMTLTTAYDAAKSAAAQSSLEDALEALDQILGAVAGKHVISADGLTVAKYDKDDNLLVTLTRSGTGPYTWSAAWE